MAAIDDLRAAKGVLRGQLLQLGLGGRVVARRATLSVSAAVALAGRNVHAIGIGRKVAGGQETTDLAVRIYVVQKLPDSLLSPRDRLPKMVDGVPTDIVESDPAFLLAKTKAARSKRKPLTRRREISAAAEALCSSNRRKRQRPIVAGISAAHREVTAGTIACFCRSTHPGDATTTYVLSNNHVFADVNKGRVGDPLYQPGPLDGAFFEDHFANLHRFVRIEMGGMLPNRIDAAIGVLLDTVTHQPEICTIGGITGTVEATDEMLVRKHGRTTGYTEGKITDVEYDALVGMDHNDTSVVALFEDQLRIETTELKPIGLGGDSGSAVVDRRQNRIVGLYFAGPSNGFYGVANKIQHVLAELEITIP